MAHLPQTALSAGAGRPGWRAAAWLALAALAGGCATLGPATAEDGPPPPGAVCQAVVTWHPRVAFAADPANGGTPGPGIAGRLYLFGPQVGFPVVGDGSLEVVLYDESGCPDRPAKMQEGWKFDPVTFKCFLRQDMIGWGYTVFLPWANYRPDITRVRLKVCYQPAKGAPVYAESAPLTLGAEGGPARAPAARQTAARQPAMPRGPAEATVQAAPPQETVPRASAKP